MEYTGGPFNMKVSRERKTVTLSVVRGSDVLTEIKFPVGAINKVIEALKDIR
jgi:hypothetical protein